MKKHLDAGLPHPASESHDRIEHLPDSAIEALPDDHAEQEAARRADLDRMQERQEQEAAVQQKRDQAAARKQVAAIHARDQATPEQRRAQMKQQQATDLRRREMRLQEQLDQVPWYKMGRRKQLKSALAITVERLNGLSESTPEMRAYERRAAVQQGVGESIPGAQRAEVHDYRPLHIQARDTMREAKREQQGLGFFAKLFNTAKARRANSKLKHSSDRYMEELRKNYGEVHLSEEDMDNFNRAA